MEGKTDDGEQEAAALQARLTILWHEREKRSRARSRKTANELACGVCDLCDLHACCLRVGGA